MLTYRALRLLSVASKCAQSTEMTTISSRRSLFCISNRIPFNLPTTISHTDMHFQLIEFKPKPVRHVMPRFYSDSDRKNIDMKVAKGKQMIKDAIQIKRTNFKEKKEVFVKDFREKKTQMKEKVQEKVKEMEEIVERENIFTIPNLLCVARGALSPVVGYAIIHEQYLISIGILTIAGITDLADGYIARNWPSQASKLGSFLDPMADKILVGALVISLSYSSLFPIWLSAMVICRDAFLIIAGFVIRFISLPPPKTLSRYFDATHVTAKLEPTFISKVNTAVQLFAIGASLGAPIWCYVDHTNLHGLWYLTGATTMAAALSYVLQKDTYKIIKGQLKKTP